METGWQFQKQMRLVPFESRTMAALLCLEAAAWKSHTLWVWKQFVFHKPIANRRFFSPQVWIFFEALVHLFMTMLPLNTGMARPRLAVNVLNSSSVSLHRTSVSLNSTESKMFSSNYLQWYLTCYILFARSHYCDLHLLSTPNRLET